MQLGFIDRNNMTYGWAGNITLTGDVAADMDKIRAFYDGKAGFYPKKGSVPRLRAEDDIEARTWLLDGIDLDRSRAGKLHLSPESCIFCTRDTRERESGDALWRLGRAPHPAPAVTCPLPGKTR